MVGVWLVRGMGAAVVGILGWLSAGLSGVSEGFEDFVPWGLTFGLAGAVVGGGLAAFLTRSPWRAVQRLWEETSAATLLAGVSGLILGLLAAALLSIPMRALPSWPATWVPILLSLCLGALGVALMISRDQEIFFFLPESARSRVRERLSHRNGRILVDTSAIIDGRIADVIQAGFVSGTLAIPRFVLDELRRVADSSDSLRRSRGRRGLETLNRLRKDSQVPLQVLDVDVRNGLEVDSNLVKLARTLGAQLLTTDYNLNRVAEIQGVRVLNMNELANAMKPVFLPGEEMAVQIVQEGKEVGQGVGFLDDGTMVVVENGRRYINSVLDVTVTRVLQTGAGRLIFAQPRGR